ncbi:hypothetical protein HYV87_04220, partial [Candidatus Woesearchaeota archaeon]|nr:hypothetical protein [Candidatus Woesearchaeota archaeon]
IKSRIFRAKEKLRGLLGDYDRKQTYDHGREDHYAQHNGANGNTDGHGRDEPHHWDDLVIKVDKALYNELHKILTPKQINPGVNNHPS